MTTGTSLGACPCTLDSDTDLLSLLNKLMCYSQVPVPQPSQCHWGRHLDFEGQGLRICIFRGTNWGLDQVYTWSFARETVWFVSENTNRLLTRNGDSDLRIRPIQKWLKSVFDFVQSWEMNPHRQRYTIPQMFAVSPVMEKW